MSSYFEVAPEELGRLSAQEAVAIFRDLVFAEAKSIGGVELGKVAIPSSIKAITTRDGGIDGQVSGAHPKREGHGIIKPGLTCYQIKTGSADVNTVKKARDVISTKSGICDRVKSCIENDGTLIIVLFGNDTPDRKHEQSVQCLQEAISHFMPGYSSYQKIEVWHQSDLVGFLQDYPALCMRVKRQQPSNLMAIDAWSQLQTMRHEMVLGENQQSAIEAIRASVTEERAEALRVLGEAGVGKTRLVLEALFAGNCRETVVYAEKPSALPPGFLSYLASNNPLLHCVLVVDECDSSHHGDIWNKIEYVSDRIKLITIFNGAEHQYDGQSIVEISPLSQDETASIIESYGIRDYRARELAAFCNGSPRVAHMLGEQASRHGNIDISYKDDVWLRCIAGADDPSGEETKKRMRVLKWLALFRRFGYEGPYKEEGNLIVAKIKNEIGLHEGEIREIIEHLRDKKLLQGDYTLYITPRLMHIWLWVEWWKVQGPGFDFEKFKRIDDATELSDKLLDWFFDMLQYGRESSVVPKIIDDLFSEHGPFASPAFLKSSTGERLLSALSDIDPRKTLAFIEGVLAPHSTEELLAMHRGRRGLIDALQRTAWEPGLFARSAKMLSKLALAENEQYSNNATGVLADLFDNGIGMIAPTQASPKDRFPMLEELAHSSSLVDRALAIELISSALEVTRSRFIAVRDSDWLREETLGWQPESYEELREAYDRVWILSIDCLESYDDENLKKLTKTMSSACMGLVRFFRGDPVVLGWIQKYASCGAADDKTLIRDLTLLTGSAEDLPDETKSILNDVLRELEGSGYEAEMRRYVGMRLFEDEIVSEESGVSVLDMAIPRLAHDTLANPLSLNSILPWLVSKSPENGYRFGKELGCVDRDLSLWPSIVEALRSLPRDERGTQVCEGYLGSVFNEDVHYWEALLDRLSEDKELSYLVPTMTCGSGMTDESLERIVKLVSEEKAGRESLSALGYGNLLANVSDTQFERLIRWLIEGGESGLVRLALNLLFGRLRDGRSVPPILKEEVLCHDALFRSGANKPSTMLSFAWREVSISYLSECPECISGFAEQLVGMLGEANAPEFTYHYEALCKLVDIRPDEAWAALAPRLSENAFIAFEAFIRHHEDGGLIARFPQSIVTGWIDDDPNMRAPLIARHISSSLYDQEGKPLIARDLLARYGSDENVRRALHTNRWILSWTGSEVVMLDGKISQLETWKEMDDDPHVRLWIDEAIDRFLQEREHAVIREEREDW